MLLFIDRNSFFWFIDQEYFNICLGNATTVQLWSPNQAPEQCHTQLNFMCFSFPKEKKKKKLISTQFLWYSHKQLMKERICLTSPPLRKASPYIYASTSIPAGSYWDANTAL